jgi:hypothetical protein
VGSIFGDGLGEMVFDSDNNVYIVGSTDSETLGTLNAYPISDSPEENINGIIVKFNPEGALIWSKYVGGPKIDNLNYIAIHNGYLYVTGRTNSVFELGTAGSFQDRLYSAPISTVGFISKLDLEGNLIWSTYYGQTKTVNGISGITVNDTGVFVVGYVIDEAGNTFFTTPFKDLQRVMPSDLRRRVSIRCTTRPDDVL